MNRYPWTWTMDARQAIGLGLSWLGPLLLVLACAGCQEQPYRVCDTGLVCQLGYECSPEGDFCVLPNGCGNGRIDFREVCDDGNRVSGDGCSQDCTSDERCGNRVRDRWENCDDGNTMDRDGCSRICRLEHCGNGALDPRETCDDGGSENGDGCSADCLSMENCGNGYIDVVHDEECDDGNSVDGDGCSADCMDENCGNGLVDPGERCDDGNTENGDGCSADCQSDERCGNGIVDFSIGEQCDDGETRDGDGCHADCRRGTCGNGIVDEGEACDDGNTASGDGCSADCLYDEDCGNGVLEPGELCDPGSGESCNDVCTSDLTCSNRYYDPKTEQCDDGGNSPFCDLDCTRVNCGDGVQNDAAGEACDQKPPSLASLVVSGIAPAIELMPDKFEYVIDLPLLQASATITVTVATPGDTVIIAGTPMASGKPSAELPLGLGDNPVDIVVENPMGQQSVYGMNLRRATQLAQYAYGKASNTSADDELGFSVAVSGDTLAVGAPGEASAARGVDGDQDGEGAPNSGAVYVFRRTGVAWQQEAYIKASNTDAFDDFGWSVALSSDTLAVGARLEDSAALGVDGDQEDDEAADSGAVYVFRRTGTVWQQEEYLKASNTGTDDRFGASLALEGDTLVVGAPLESSAAQGVGGNQADDTAPGSGAVYVFRRTGTDWQQEEYLKASNTDAGDFFGGSVALSGDVLAVGAPLEASASQGVDGNQDDNTAADSGAVYVFRRTGTDWQQEEYLKASNTDAGDFFGASVALSGDTLAVGAHGEASASQGVGGNQADDTAPGSGAVYVFRHPETDWQQEAYVKASNTDTGDFFGYSVALSGDTLAVGAHDEASAAQGVGGNQTDNGAVASGAGYVFRRTGTAWLQEAYLKASNTGMGDAFGYSVALSSDTLAVGAYQEASSAQGVGGNQNDESAQDSGAVYIFH
jgi:cysteine-rich repeat protein